VAAALLRVRQILQSFAPDQQTMTQRLALAEAMIVAALRRRESRGAHWRRDFPQRDRSCDGAGVVGCNGRNREASWRTPASDALSLNIDLSQFLAIKLLTSQAKRENFSAVRRVRELAAGARARLAGETRCRGEAASEDWFHDRPKEPKCA
jgi:hypothetical protein